MIYDKKKYSDKINIINDIETKINIYKNIYDSVFIKD